jgi:hypothetical protein
MISSLLPLLLAVPAVIAHGQVRNFITADGTVWPATDAYAVAANLSSPIRHVNTYGPVPDFTTADVTCGVCSCQLFHMSYLNAKAAWRQCADVDSRARCCRFDCHL